MIFNEIFSHVCFSFRIWRNGRRCWMLKRRVSRKLRWRWCLVPPATDPNLPQLIVGSHSSSKRYADGNSYDRQFLCFLADCVVFVDKYFSNVGIKTCPGIPAFVSVVAFFKLPLFGETALVFVVCGCSVDQFHMPWKAFNYNFYYLLVILLSFILFCDPALSWSIKVVRFLSR